MTENTAKIIVAVVLVAIGAIPVASGVCEAKKVSDYNLIMGMEYSPAQGQITGLSRSGDYVAVPGAKIFLVESASGGKTFATTIHGRNGEVIAFDDLRTGDWIYAFAGAMGYENGPEGTARAAAKDIYVIPRKMSMPELVNFTNKVSAKSWKVEMRK